MLLLPTPSICFNLDVQIQLQYTNTNLLYETITNIDTGCQV